MGERAFKQNPADAHDARHAGSIRGHMTATQA